MSEFSREELVTLAGEVHELPEGYSWGAYWSVPSEGISGRYIIRDRDGAGCRLQLRRLWYEVTAAMIEEAVDDGIKLTAERARIEGA